MEEVRKLYRIKDFVGKHTWTNEKNIVNYIHNTQKTKIVDYGAVVREGRAIYLDEDNFINWVLNHTTQLRKTYLHYKARRER